MAKKYKRRRIPPKPGKFYRQMWRVVEGAVADAFYSHPDYLSPKGRGMAASSITKRVVGAIMGYAEQSAQGRSEASARRASAADQGASIDVEALAGARINVPATYSSNLEALS